MDWFDLDGDPGLQRERTALGWQRTGLTALGVTAVFVRTRFDHLDRTAALMIVLSILVVLAVLLAAFHGPGRRDGRAAAALSALIVAIAVAQVTAVVLD